MRKCVVGFLLGSLAACLGSGSTAAAEGPALKKVRIAVGTSMLSTGYPMLTLPGPLGYWKAEGLDVELIPAGASLQALQQMVGGNADFIEVNASVIVQANSKNDLPVRVVMANGVVDWAVAVDADGPIKSIRDLKGKAIGTFSQATGGTAYLNSYLRKNDIDPKDIDFIPLGLGAPPVHALQTDRVQGLFYWATAISSFENAGLRLRKLVGDDWQSYPDYSLATMQQTLNSDPATTAAVARAMAKSIVFAMANPDCMRRIQWKDYRATMAAGTDEATLTKWYTNAQSVQLETLRESYRLNGGNAWGAVDPAAFERLSQFMLAAKLIEKPVSGKSIVIEPAISAKVDDFDRTAIEASARECRL